MRHLSIATLASVLAPVFAQIACAADALVPPSMAEVAPAYGWTGFYVGFNAGGTWANNSSADVTSTPVQGFSDGIGPGSYAAQSAASATGTVAVGNSAGFIGGGQIGYN